MTSSHPAIRRVVVFVQALAALALILVLIVGVPTLLVTLIGNPLPGGWSWAAPVSNDAVLGVVAVLVWIFWAQLLACLVIEALVELRIATGRSAVWMSRVPGTFTGQQALARGLVHAVVALGIGSAYLSNSNTADNSWTAQSATLPTTTARTDAERDPGSASARPASPTPAPNRQGDTKVVTNGGLRAASGGSARPVTVVKGDSLWSIAQQHLGGGERWRQIAELNHGRVMPGQVEFHDQVALQPGWTLYLPADQGHATIDGAPPRHVVVEPGDTLWALSNEAYGEGEDWPRIFESNRRQIADPDLIHPGQQLHIPATAHPTRCSTLPRAATPVSGQRQARARVATTHSVSRPRKLAHRARPRVPHPQVLPRGEAGD